MRTETTHRPITILLVEDNPGDVRLTEEALRETEIANRLMVVNDGQAALDFLRRNGPYADAPHPDLILLDLNLPKKDGREVLAEIKQDPHLRMIPVVVLTTSRDEGDMQAGNVLRQLALRADPEARSVPPDRQKHQGVLVHGGKAPDRRGLKPRAPRYSHFFRRKKASIPAAAPSISSSTAGYPQTHSNSGMCLKFIP